jgi:hypothetical protein
VFSALAVCAAPLHAQQGRAQLLDQARVEVDEARRLDLLAIAANPVDIDSLWAISIFEIAQIMRDRGQDDVAATWMRWARRHGRWDIDRGYFAPSLVRFYDELAPPIADPDADGGGAFTNWRWPGTLSVADAGLLEIGPSETTVALTVAVEGQGTVSPGASMALPAGTYELLASAEGYDTLRVRREVLPGVATVVSFDVAPVLDETVAQRVGPSVVRLRSPGLASPTCWNGISVGGGLVATSLSALGGATQLEVVRLEQPTLDAQVVGTDVAGDLAILAVSNLVAPPLTRAPGVQPGFAWSVFRNGCEEQMDVARSRFAGATAGLGLPAAAIGSPLIDRSGSLLGLIGEGGRISSVDVMDNLLAEAIDQVEGGGFPVVWVGLATAAVGGVLALVMGGGGDGGGNGSDTGSVVITIPTGH